MKINPVSQSFHHQLLLFLLFNFQWRKECELKTFRLLICCVGAVIAQSTLFSIIYYCFHFAQLFHRKIYWMKFFIINDAIKCASRVIKLFLCNKFFIKLKFSFILQSQLTLKNLVRINFHLSWKFYRDQMSFVIENERNSQCTTRIGEFYSRNQIYAKLKLSYSN